MAWRLTPLRGAEQTGLMSHVLGSELPDPLVTRLSGAEFTRHDRLVIPIVTVDSEGRPHPALLSYSEVVARGARALRLAIAADSRSADNLRRNGAVTVIVIDAGLVAYVKGTARERRRSMRASSWNAEFEVAVEEVLLDAADPRREGESFVCSGIAFECDPGWASGRAAVLGELLSDH